MSDIELPFIVNGWLGVNPEPLSTNVIFAGVHVGEDFGKNISWLRKSHTPIGTRDPFTDNLMRRLRIVGQMIGCATLTFDQYRGPRRGRYSVDIPPQDGTTFLSNDIDSTCSWEDRWNIASERLDQLRRAEVVYTNRLHVLLPCLAFGTPVVFPLSTLTFVTNKHRLSLLDHLNIPFDEIVQMNTSVYGDQYCAFLDGCLNSRREVSETPPMPLPINAYAGLTPRRRHFTIRRQARAPRIFYFANLAQNAMSCLGEAEDHVRILRNAGYDSFLVDHSCRRTGVNSQLSLEDLPRSYNPQNDFMAFPGSGWTYISDIRHYASRIVIYDATISHGYSGYQYKAPKEYHYSAPNIIALLTPTDTEGRILKRAHPNSRVFRVRVPVDISDVSSRSVLQKKLQVVALRSNLGHLLPLYHVFNAHTQSYDKHGLGQVQWHFISGAATPDDIAMLEESLIFIWTSSERRTIQTIVKAMACGCIPINYTIATQQGYMLPNGCTAAYDDLETALLHVEQTIVTHQSMPSTLEALSRRVRAVSETYSYANYSSDLLNAWQSILGSR